MPLRPLAPCSSAPGPVARRLLVPLAALVLLGADAAAQDVRLESHPTRWRLTGAFFSVESGGPRDGDEVGLVGIHYDVLQPFESLPGLFLGLGGYGAASGDRGGLFFGGLTAGWMHPLSPNWTLEAALFAGGGGGGDGPESEGMAIRPHVALERHLDLVSLRLEAGFLDLKDDPIDDFHLALGITIPTEILSAREAARGPEIPDVAVVERPLRITPLVQVVDTASDTRRSTGGPYPGDLSLIGIGVDYFLGPHLYVPVEAWGAAGGGASGYAAAYSGLGWSLPFFGERVRLELQALLGAAGGGELDVGGGLSWQARGGLRTQLWGPLSLIVQGGWLDAPNGSLEGSSVTAGLSWSTNTPALRIEYPRSRLESEGLSEDRARVRTTRLQVLNKTYTPRSESRTRSGQTYEKTINLLGVGFEQPVFGDISLLGRAYAAWEGDVGGYGEGLFGVKYEFAPLVDERHHFSISMEAGAGGGGGMDVGSGLIWQFHSGWRYDLSERTALSAEFGYMQPNRGSFAAETFQIGWTWDLNRAVLR